MRIDYTLTGFGESLHKRWEKAPFLDRERRFLPVFLRVYYIILLLLFYIPLSVRCAPAEGRDESSLFGPTDPPSYLSGRFKPSRHPDFVTLGPMEIPARQGMRLRKEAARALKRLYNDFHKEHPRVSFFVQSSTRNWYDQKRIWENKWKGVTKVEGKSLKATIPDPVKRALKILEFSSMPGTSRHHWGTDFDFRNMTNRYYESGEGKILYDWMRANGSRYGFCQPYTAGRKGGYEEERWHWSYKPIAAPLLAGWMVRFGKNPLRLHRMAPFAGSKEAIDLAPLYVKSVNPECL